jgi:8-amino-7-oxononanoate synthase
LAKGLGCHGAAILGSEELAVLNFARSFIYTTGLSPHSVATILIAISFRKEKQAIETLKTISLISISKRIGLKPLFIRSKSAIQSAIIPGNENVKNC